MVVLTVGVGWRATVRGVGTQSVHVGTPSVIFCDHKPVGPMTSPKPDPQLLDSKNTSSSR